MHSIIYLAVMFIAKVIDNAINTTKTIMIQEVGGYSQELR